MRSYVVCSLVLLLGCASAQSSVGPDGTPLEFATQLSAGTRLTDQGASDGQNLLHPIGGKSSGTAQRDQQLGARTVGESEGAQGEQSSVQEYDLAADLERRKQAARRDLGQSAELEVVADVFMIASMRGQGFGAARIAEQAIVAYFNGRFERHPNQAISVYLFPSSKPYQKYCRARWNSPCISIYGFYQSDERQIVLDVGPGVGTLTHELVHPILKADFPEAPIWLEEGIASLYEGFSLGKRGQIRGVKNWRWPALVTALNQPERRKTTRIDSLFGMDYETFRGDDESLNYALARYFCLWLEQKGMLWSFYHAWRDGYASDPNGEQAFRAVIGKPPSEVNADWERWLRRL